MSDLIERLEKAAIVQYQTSQTADSAEEFMEWEAAAEIKRLRAALETLYWAGWSDCNALGYENCNGKTRDKAIAEALSTQEVDDE